MEPNDSNYDPDDYPTPSIDDGFNPEIMRRRRRTIDSIILLVTAAALVILIMLLGGCAKYVNPVNQTMVYQLGNAYGVAQSAAVTYDSFPLCNEALGITKLCRTKQVSALLAKYDAAFITAYDKLQAFVRNPKNYPGLSLSQLYQAAVDALATFKNAEAAYNVGKV